MASGAPTSVVEFLFLQVGGTVAGAWFLGDLAAKTYLRYEANRRSDPRTSWERLGGEDFSPPTWPGYVAGLVISYWILLGAS
jgi:hypothetical protein